MRAPRFEVVQSDTGWFARFRAANGRIVWVTESYTRRRMAERAIWLLDPMANAPFEVRTVDERTPPPAPVVLELPFYVRDASGLWHDSEYHYRHCFSDECSEGTPPKGTEVRGRFGSAVTR